jgi:hypothetical protein
MSNRNKANDILGISLSDMSFTSDKKQTFVPILIIPNENTKQRGRPVDNFTLAKLKLAVLAESWITIEILCNLDIREMTGQYNERELFRPDYRKSKEKRIHAELIVSDVHNKWRDTYRKALKFKVGYEFSKIQRSGEEAARRHLNIIDSRELKDYLRRVKLIASREALPDASDLELAQNEILKIRALLIGVAKCQEFINVYNNFSNDRKKKLGRKPTLFTHEIDITIERQYVSKIELPSFNDLLMIAAHGDVNPTALWNNISSDFEVLEFQRLIGKAARRHQITNSELSFIEETITVVSSRTANLDTPAKKYLREMVTWYLARS